MRRALGAQIAAAALLAVAATPASAAYPGADGTIVFQSNRDVGAGDLYTVVPGGATQRLTVSTTSSDPVYSPDGTKIAYVSSDPGSGYNIYVINADGTGRHAITTGQGAKLQPTWSPDGTKIAFVANSFEIDGQTDQEIWTVNLDGTGVTQVTNNTVPDTEPAWSPLGDKIALVSSGDVFTIDPSGGNRTNLTPDSPPGCSPNCYQGADTDPAWSPSGAQLAYVHGAGISGGGLPAIWTMNADGSGKANLTNNANVSFAEPAWSPQGTRLVAVGATNTDRDIWIMNADGSGQTPLDPNPAHDISPDWGPAAPPPSNDFAISKPKLNTRTGTAKLPVVVPGPGELTLGGKGVASQRPSARVARMTVGSAGTVSLKVKAKGKAKRKLNATGRVRVKAKVTFTPSGGTPNSQTKTIRLRKRIR